MSNKSYIVLHKTGCPTDDGIPVEAVSHPYCYIDHAKIVALELAKDNPGGVYYVAAIEVKVTCPPSQPIIEYFS